MYYGWKERGFDEVTGRWWAYFWNDGRIEASESFDTEEQMTAFVSEKNEKLRNMEW